MNKSSLSKAYDWFITFIGITICIVSAYALLTSDRLYQLFQLQFFLLAFFTVVVASRISVQIPNEGGGHITVSDTMLFLTMLLYDGEVAILLAAAEGFCSFLSFERKVPRSTILFNGASMASSTFATVWTLRLIYGQITDLPRAEYSFLTIGSLLIMAFVQYIANSGLVAVRSALKRDLGVIETWRKYYLWTSITYLAGAAAAIVIAKIVVSYGFYAVLLATPIISIIYLTYRTYLKNVEASATAAKAQEAQRFYEEREQMREQYAQIEKLSALGELASGVAHNFNNTLAGILGRAQMLQNAEDLIEIRSGLSIIVRVAEDGARTVKRIQDFARQRRDHDFTPLAVDQLLLDTSEITRPRWKNHAEADDVHIDLELQIASQATVMGDPGELREVLVNLVFNAVDAMPQGGKLRLATHDRNGFVEISVSDTGTGMSEETRTRVFDPFFTTKGKAGLGLGLAVSYGIIRRHEGVFEVESEVGRGTTFRINLPIAVNTDVPARVEPAATLRQLQNPRERGEILVVDDEEYVRELLQDVLQAEGFRVVLARDGLEALDLYERKQIAGVLTDVGLPGMSGWELSRHLRERDPDLPIAIITGWGDSVGSEEQRAAGVEWVVTKPFSVDRIVQIAQMIAARHAPDAASVSLAHVDQDGGEAGLIN